jgi:hypothetical protein
MVAQIGSWQLTEESLPLLRDIRQIDDLFNVLHTNRQHEIEDPASVLSSS